jgi:hypothetical protein
MFNILWIEDELKPVEQLAPILAKMPGLSLSVLLFAKGIIRNDLAGVEAGGVDIEIIDTNQTMNLEEFWQFVVKAYEKINPWLVITDLRLPEVTPAYQIKTKQGMLPAAGVNLTQLLFERTSCRNIIWLTQHGSAVVRMPTFVVRDWEKGGVNIISFPQTFVVDKTNIETHIPGLIVDLTERLLDQVRSLLNYRIEASKIAGLFRLLSSDSLKHFFTKPSSDSSAFEQTKRKLDAYDLIPYNDPPITFSTWLRAYHSNGQLLESLRREDDLDGFARSLAIVLGEHLWGMAISELEEFFIYASRHNNVNTELLDLTLITSPQAPANMVIGPIARSLLICALGNVVQNAQQHGREGAKIKCWSQTGSEAIYLVIANEVNDFGVFHSQMTDKITNKRLRGIQLARSSIDGLNQLHEGQQSAELEGDEWGRWGYRTVAWDNDRARVLFFGSPNGGDDENAINFSRTGYLHSREQEFLFELCSSFGREWNTSGVMSIFRLPLVCSEDLAQRSPREREFVKGV